MPLGKCASGEPSIGMGEMQLRDCQQTDRLDVILLEGPLKARDR